LGFSKSVMKRQLLLILIILLVISACSIGQDLDSQTTPAPTQSSILPNGGDQLTEIDSSNNQPVPYWPTDGWRTSSPVEQGMDSALLVQMFESIDQHNLEIDSVLVVRNGYIVAEKYYSPYSENTRHVLYSCTKSFVSALVGMAIEDGYIEGVNIAVQDSFPELIFENGDERKQVITLEDLLTMRSGLDWVEGMPSYRAMMDSRDWTKYVLDIPMATDPGSQFNYCSGCSHVMSAIIEQSTEMGTMAYARDRLFKPLGITNYQELDWWDSIKFNGLNITCSPAQHFSNRGLFDRNKTLWCGWIISGKENRFYFAGDTGYFPGFKEIAEKYGPFDFAAIPIGAYLPRWFMGPVHLSPDEAVKVFREINSKFFVPIHWGTFELADEPLDQPPKELLKEIQNQSLNSEQFLILKHGETKIIKEINISPELSTSIQSF